MALSIYFLRHGQTAFSRSNSFCGSGLDPDLTPIGLEMAQAFAASYSSTPWQAIYSSPLKRSLFTAQVLSQAVGMELKIRDELKEIGYGVWEGKSVEDVNRDFHDDYIKWSADPAWNSPTGGEPAMMIARRGIQVVEEVRQTYKDGNILIVSHKATIRTVLCALLGIDVGRFRSRLACPVASVSIVEFGNAGPLLKALADMTHLNESLRRQPGT
ncbi:MAG TPA: histidine phosphatase family protein [Pyrinomonadaceae bacterium]|nr:histidine phosphatase family protein [Pyrinomonadaceae bacterium]